MRTKPPSPGPVNVALLEAPANSTLAAIDDKLASVIVSQIEVAGMCCQSEVDLIEKTTAGACFLYACCSTLAEHVELASQERVRQRKAAGFAPKVTLLSRKSAEAKVTVS